MGRCPDGAQVLARGWGGSGGGVGCFCGMLVGCLSRRLGRLRTGRRQGGGQFPSRFPTILSIGFPSPDMRSAPRRKGEFRSVCASWDHLARLPPPATRPLITRIPECRLMHFPLVPPEHALPVCKCSRGCAFSAAVRFAPGVGFPCPCQLGRGPTSEPVVHPRGRVGRGDGQSETLQGGDRNCRWFGLIDRRNG
jgi:hypothetical protein